ncbi:TPA: hypothetical protein QHP59_002609 [Klebsiella variicola]|nr:hypothetical protein [Klebsiella variicola]HDS5948177.1 hypothetical protein [Klebsiella variicola]HDT2760603.1 hypothetical protein [Klebsiella variicola]
MTTNITILVQRLKVAAKNGCCHTLIPDDCLALVEALEKAQQRIDELLPSSGNMLMPALEGLSRDHLLVTTQTAVDNYSVLHTKWLKDRQRIAVLDAELEREIEKSRRVMSRITELEGPKKKRLPEPYAYLRENDGQIQISIGAERPSDRSGGYATPWFAIYTAAGIKVGAE